MLKGFKEFLLKNNVLALAVAVIVGGAVGKVVSSLAADIIMPLVSLLLPSGGWRTAAIEISRSGPVDKPVINSLAYGQFAGSVVDFVIIALVVYIMTKALLREKPVVAPATKECPRCLETVPAAATKCKFCTSDL